jgi:DNA-binding SARP family transcriptional activator
MSWRHLLEASGGGCISTAVQALRRTAANQAKANLHYFAGITLHNTATAELARGNYEQVRELAEESISHLERTDVFGSITASTRSLMALALAELGQIEEALRLANQVASEPGATADAIAEAAYLHGVCGRTRRARALIAKFERGEAPWAGDPTSRAFGCHARATIAMAGRDYSLARDEIDRLGLIEPADFDAPSRLAVLEALVALAERSDDAHRLARTAVATSTAQNAWRWAARARILEAATRRDAESLALWVTEAESDSALSVLEVADGVAAAIGTLAPLPEALERSMLREPARWVSALSGQLGEPPSEDARAAASLIARFGTEEAVPLLREFDRATSGKRSRRGVASQLVRRVSPIVRVHDLGLSSYEVGERRVPLTETRRKPAALLLYLVTRVGLGAGREQAMECMWPDQSPKSALNSLHQTIFFLRRDIEPWYEEGVTADYIHLEGEMVWLDRDLFQIDSVAFSRQASGILSSGSAITRGRELLGLYRGQFAPEFEYEEWATEWRSHLHTTYLRLAHATSKALIDEYRFGEAVEVLSPVVALDPKAFDLSSTLVACLAAAGATDAAHAHYRSMAASHERELGIPARSYQQVLTTVPRRN